MLRLRSTHQLQLDSVAAANDVFTAPAAAAAVDNKSQRRLHRYLVTSAARSLDLSWLTSYIGFATGVAGSLHHSLTVSAFCRSA